MDNLLEKLANKTATIGIIGMGYVGLPLALRFSEAGFRTIGFDIDSEKVAKLNRGESYVTDQAMRFINCRYAQCL